MLNRETKKRTKGKKGKWGVERESINKILVLVQNMA